MTDSQQLEIALDMTHEYAQHSRQSISGLLINNVEPHNSVNYHCELDTLALDDMFPLWVASIKTCRAVVQELIGQGYKPILALVESKIHYRLLNYDGRYMEINLKMYEYAKKIIGSDIKNSRKSIGCF